MSVHHRQFVIGSERVSFDDNWLSLELPEGFFLSYEKDLDVASIDANGRQMLFLGAAIPVDGPDDTAQPMPSGNCGRYVCVDWPYIHLDSSGLLAIQFVKSDTHVYVSSSPALLAKLTAGEALRRDFRDDGPGWGGMNWVPSPRSQAATATRLLHDQKLHIPSLAVSHAPRTFVALGTEMDGAAALAAVLTRASRQIGRASSTVYLALTGGLDSRTLLAALVASEVKFECVTQAFNGMTREDVGVAQKICSRFGIKHHVIGPQARDQRKLDAWREHTLGSYHDADDVHLFPQNQYRFLTKGSSVVRGGCFEIGRRYYETQLAGLTLENATATEIWKRFEIAAPMPAMIEALDDWLSWRREHPIGLDVVDAFYLDQRMGGWLSSLEHAIDCLPGRSVVPANNERALCALLSAGNEDRRSGRIQRECIRQLEPKLLEIPINPTGLARRLRGFAGKAARRVVPTSLMNTLRGR